MRNNFLTSAVQQISTGWQIRRGNVKSNNVRRVQAQPARLMVVLAHPDDEALTVGGTLAKYAAAGVEITLLVATRGERGWRGNSAADPGLRRMGEIREREVRAAAREL